MLSLSWTLILLTIADDGAIVRRDTVSDLLMYAFTSEGQPDCVDRIKGRVACSFNPADVVTSNQEL